MGLHGVFTDVQAAGERQAPVLGSGTWLGGILTEWFVWETLPACLQRLWRAAQTESGPGASHLVLLKAGRDRKWPPQGFRGGFTQDLPNSMFLPPPTSSVYILSVPDGSGFNRWHFGLYRSKLKKNLLHFNNSNLFTLDEISNYLICIQLTPHMSKMGYESITEQVWPWKLKGQRSQEVIL